MPAIPNHLAIIPDGNRRWAKQNHLPTLEGHRRGAQRFQEIAKHARAKGVQTLTAWGFSTENWGREDSEVLNLMDLFVWLIRSHRESAHQDQVRVRHLGRKDHLPEKLLAEIHKIETETARYTRYNFNICIDYGGQDEIIRAIQKMFNSLKSSGLDSSESLTHISNFIEELTPATFSTYLDTAGQPNPTPDLIIRTSGEMRTSGLLPFQSVYSELYFENAYLPDFTIEKFELALEEYARRDRRFGSNSQK